MRQWSGAVFAILAVVGFLGGVTASAQEPATESRLTVERIRSGLLVAPDLKLTSIDGGSGAVAGLYGGFITDRRLLLGAGAYWLTSGPAGVDMAYGGGLVEWFREPGRAGVGFQRAQPVRVRSGNPSPPRSTYLPSMHFTAVRGVCFTLDTVTADIGTVRLTGVIGQRANSAGRVRSRSATATIS